MQILDSLVDGALMLSNQREGDELIGMIVRYLRTGANPNPRTDAQKMALAMIQPVLEKSRNRIEAGSKGGSKTTSKRTSKTESKEQITKENKQSSNSESKPPSDIYSSSSIPLPMGEDRGFGGKERENIPFDAIINHLNSKTGSLYRSSTPKTRSLIRARWSEGFRLDDFFSVIDTMTSEWLSEPKMYAYLRPETLFGTKFESYLNRKARKEVSDIDYSEYA